MRNRFARLLVAALAASALSLTVMPGMGDDPHGAFAVADRTYTSGRF
jgi:hypothetical protein